VDVEKWFHLQATHAHVTTNVSRNGRERPLVAGAGRAKAVSFEPILALSMRKNTFTSFLEQQLHKPSGG